MPKPIRPRGRRPASMLVSSLTLLSLTACSVSPEPLTLEDQIAQAASDRQAMFQNQEPVTAPITLEEAMARAVKYNLDQRLSLMERALQDGLTDVANLDMLPKLAAKAGWRTRSNEAASSSESIRTHRESLEPSRSSERSGETAGLELSWNVLDFGISYFGAKAQGNKALAAEERRRAVVADILQKVRVAYWDAATAQHLRPQVRDALKEARVALDRARQSERERLMRPVEAMRYQKSLLEMIRQLEALEGDLATAKSTLASLMNLPPATDYDLAVPSEGAMTPPDLAYTLEDLETMAMVRRPEIREASYNARNAVLETRMSLLRLLPGANLFAGLNHDGNDFLVHNNWADAGVQVSWNLLGLASYPARAEAGEAREAMAEVRRQAMRMAVLTQVNLSWQQYQKAKRIFESSDEVLRLQRGIMEQSTRTFASNAQSMLDHVRTRTETILAARTRDRSLAEMQAAYGAIYKASGLDPLPEQVAGHGLAQLSRAIASNAGLLAQGKAKIAHIPDLPIATAAVESAPLPAVTPAAAEACQPQSCGRATALRLDMWENHGSLVGAEVVGWDDRDAL